MCIATNHSLDSNDEFIIKVLPKIESPRVDQYSVQAGSLSIMFFQFELESNSEAICIPRYLSEPISGHTCFWWGGGFDS